MVTITNPRRRSIDSILDPLEILMLIISFCLLNRNPFYDDSDWLLGERRQIHDEIKENLLSQIRDFDCTA
jgi:hypothetical protein